MLFINSNAQSVTLQYTCICIFCAAFIRTVWVGVNGPHCCFLCKTKVSYQMTQTPGGGGGTSICMHIGYMPGGDTPTFMWTGGGCRSGVEIIFTNVRKKCVPEHHHITFLGGFCLFRPYFLKISLILTLSQYRLPRRLSPERAFSVRQRRWVSSRLRAR